ncbi:hypothetical protein GCM10008098_07660 [Rhodanobacter panaciterrae]|uniref:Cupin domain-containing protein n=1 Tax=Rhodanobacter panaciterrae TaxID=490572 RepID=A0ABQ2ZMZ2_9GAMM|nr:hypothetical protein [Rhodanobacter panaciterrae]GGY18206.1 hypothetical protein GCM10008098_07660 [Rhodanobacter panaciterrae]
MYVLVGELTLVTGAGEQLLRAGDSAAFRRNVLDDHHMINRGAIVAVYLDIDPHCADDTCSYSDIDLHIDPEPAGYTHKDGKKYP